VYHVPAAHRTYYAAKVENWIVEDSAPTYMIRVEKALEEERQRVAAYLNAETEPKLLQVRYSLGVCGEYVWFGGGDFACVNFLRRGRFDCAVTVEPLLRRVLIRMFLLWPFLLTALLQRLLLDFSTTLRELFVSLLLFVVAAE
jgi:hypothetical protein